MYVLFDNVDSKVLSYKALVRKILFIHYIIIFYILILKILYKCLIVVTIQVFLNVDIDVDTSKLQAKEERDSMSGGLRGISQSKMHFTETIFSFNYQKLYFSIQNTRHKDHFLHSKQWHSTALYTTKS